MPQKDYDVQQLWLKKKEILATTIIVFAYPLFIHPFCNPTIVSQMAIGSLTNKSGVANEGKTHFLKAPSNISRKIYIHIAFLYKAYGSPAVSLFKLK